MKANAPEKIYLHLTTENHLLNDTYYKHKPAKIRYDDKIIEYCRTDAFIEKACEFMRNHIDPQLTIYHEQTWCKRDEFIEIFCKYMKGK